MEAQRGYALNFPGSALLHRYRVQPTCPGKVRGRHEARAPRLRRCGTLLGALGTLHTLTLKGLIPTDMRPAVTRVHPRSPAQHVVPVPATEGIVASAPLSEQSGGEFASADAPAGAAPATL